MAVDNVARALAAKALGQSTSDVTKDYVDTELAKKFDKTGGAITGDVAIQGDLTVSGTTTTEYEKQLLVEDNVIATNANKVDLQTLLSGLAINKNPNATYGIMYDPVDDTVKFGEGTLDENNKFVFKEDEGSPLAIRADSGTFTDAHLVKWDTASKSFVDAGVGISELSKAVKAVSIEGVPGATNGTLTEEQLATLEANENNYIMFDHKKYYLEGNGHQEGYLTYTYVGYENHVHLLESITITISTKAWVLSSTTVYNTVTMSQAAYDELESPDDYTVYLIKG